MRKIKHLKCFVDDSRSINTLRFLCVLYFGMSSNIFCSVLRNLITYYCSIMIESNFFFIHFDRMRQVEVRTFMEWMGC